jgi:ElaB/YqjD/DUF883 family membrane-anchored ribosome-binding protein
MSAAGGDVQEVVFNTIEEYMDKRNTISADSNRKKISKLLLPADVHLLFSEQQEITREFMDTIDKEKELVAKDIDEFLKSVIETMDKVKEMLYQRSDNYAVQFDGYYKNFAARVGEFISESIGQIQK